MQDVTFPLDIFDVIHFAVGGIAGLILSLTANILAIIAFCMAALKYYSKPTQIISNKNLRGIR